MSARHCYLSTLDLHTLDLACRPLQAAFPFGLYLVGSATEGSDFRDVDVRVILDDAEFDALFAARRELWSVVCVGTSAYLRSVTSLPIDFQIQRMSEANEKYDGTRYPLGHGRDFAGLGDATRFTPRVATS